jgi:hypothetical protein
MRSLHPDIARVEREGIAAFDAVPQLSGGAWPRSMLGEAELLASLARSEAEPAAGQIVSGDEMLRELDESIACMVAKRAGRTPRRSATRR